MIVRYPGYDYSVIRFDLTFRDAQFLTDIKDRNHLSPEVDQPHHPVG